MKLGKLLKFIFALLLLVAVTIGLTSINHPIILKWVTGSARHFGQSIPATVYANGQENGLIKVFYTDEANNYLVSLAEYDSLGMLKFININLSKKWIASPVGLTKKDYDFIGGHLFLSDKGQQFSPLQNETQLSFIDRQIKFNLPSNKLKLDSIRIKLH